MPRIRMTRTKHEQMRAFANRLIRAGKRMLKVIEEREQSGAKTTSVQMMSTFESSVVNAEKFVSKLEIDAHETITN